MIALRFKTSIGETEPKTHYVYMFNVPMALRMYKHHDYFDTDKPFDALDHIDFGVLDDIRKVMVPTIEFETKCGIFECKWVQVKHLPIAEMSPKWMERGMQADSKTGAIVYVNKRPNGCPIPVKVWTIEELMRGLFDRAL